MHRTDYECTADVCAIERDGKKTEAAHRFVVAKHSSKQK